MKVVLTGAALVTLIAAGSAAGADLSTLPPGAPVYPIYKGAPPVAWTWTSFYIGGNLGGAWANNSVTDSTGLSLGNGSDAVFVGGGQVGFNYQFGSTVFGAEAGFDWLVNHNTTSSAVVGPFGDTFTASTSDRWVATVAGRLGYAVDHALFYVKGGGAWVGTNGFTVSDLTAGTSVNVSGSNTVGGWLVGAGLEWAFTNNLSLRAEYEYVGLSGRTFTIPATSPVLPGDIFTSGTNNIQMATVGINYLFGWH